MRDVHGWRRVLRWLFAIVGGLVGLATLALVIGFVAFQTGWGRGVLKDQIQSRLESALVGGGSVGSVEGNPLSTLVLRDLVIYGPDKQPAITVKRLHVSLPLLPLISHQLRVETLVAEELDVHVKRLANGKLNVASLLKPAAPSTWSLALPDVVVHRGHLRLDRIIGDELIDLDNLEVSVDANLPFGGPLAANARVTGDWRQKQVPLSAGAMVRRDGNTLELPHAAVRIGEVRAIALGLKVPRSAFEKPFAGTVAITAPAAAVHALVPQVTLPADIAASVTARADGRLTAFRSYAAVGRGRLEAFGRADVQAMLLTGIVVATDLDLRELTSGALDGGGGGVAALHLDASTRGALPTVAGMVTAWSSLRDTPPFQVLAAVNSRDDRVLATLSAATDSGIRVGAGGEIRKRGTAFVLEHSDLVATTLDVQRAAAGKAPVRGALTANLKAKGTLAPSLDVSVAGHARGRNLRAFGVRADHLALRIDAAHIPSRPTGNGHLDVDNLERGEIKIGRLTIDASHRRDGKLQVAVRSEPKPAPWRVELDALVTTGETFIVELQRHLVHTGGGATWSGNAGRVTISPRAVELRGLRSTTLGSSLAADATYVRAGRGRGDLSARVDAAITLGCLSKTTRGRVEAHVDVERKGRRFTGTVRATGRGVSFDPQSSIAFDGEVDIAARPDQLTATVDVSTPNSGSAKVALDVDTPNDLTDLHAWRKLDRRAIRSVKLTANEVKLLDVATLIGTQRMGGLAGMIDGSVELSPARAAGTIKLHDVTLDAFRNLGSLDADLGVTPSGTDAVKATLTAHLVPNAAAEASKDVTKDTAARVYAEATFATPERIFDPAAWMKLDANAFRGGKLNADRLVFRPGTLERLGIISKMSGAFGVGAEVSPGLQKARIAVDVHELRGGVFAEAIAGRMTGEVDEQSTRITVDVRTGPFTLVQFSSHVPVTFDQLRANPEIIETASLSARARIDQVPVKALMNVLGTNPVTGGTLDGIIDLAGTVSRPTVDAKLVARGVSVPSESARQVQYLRQLSIAATWDGANADVAIDGDQSAGGTLKLRATGSPRDLGNVTASVRATKLDLAPLVAIVPGPVGGVGGRMDADLTLRGADPRTARISGSVNVSKARIPIAPAVGTLFNAEVKATVKDGQLDLTAKGKLGTGGASVVARAPLDGLVPNTGKFKLRLDKVRLLGIHEPILTGLVDGDVERIGFVWHATLMIDRATMKVPGDRGAELAPVGAPNDMVFGGEQVRANTLVKSQSGLVKDRGEGPRVYRRLTSEPVLVAHIELRNVFVESEEVRGLVNGKLKVSFGNNAEMGMVGDLGLTRGMLELFSRRYDIDKALLHYDGSLDPILEIRITHDFPEVTTITEVRGRLSNPRLVMTSDPAQYSQAELLGFLLGGEPGGDPEKAPSATERAVGAGASLISNRISGYVRRALPLNIDVLRYETETSTSSASLTIGKWITDTLFLAYRRRLEPRPDENASEGEAEWWIRRRLVIEGILGDRGVNGADLLWRRRW